MTDTTPATDDEIRDMSMKQLRKEHPSGFMELFEQPSIRFILDALLEYPPDREFTKTELADQAGISTETLRKSLDTLTKLGIITPVENTQRYQFHPKTPVSKALVELSGSINAMARDETQTALDHIDNFPDTRTSYYCDDCGERGTYVGQVLTGHVLECPNDCMEWTHPTGNPPGATIRLETRLADDSYLEALQSKANADGMDELTPHEQALVSCAFDDETPPPLFEEFTSS